MSESIFQWRNYISPIMVLVAGPTLLVLYLTLDLKHVISDQALRRWMFYIPLTAFFVLKVSARLLRAPQQDANRVSHRIRDWLEAASLVFICLPCIYIFFFFWVGLKA